MFTCPKCVGHSFRSTTLRDGSVERECRGQVKEIVQVTVSKSDRHERGASPSAQTMTRACTHLFLSSDDHLYGVTAEDGSEQPPPELTTIQKEQRHDQAQ